MRGSACQRCRAKKLKCDGPKPCQHCRKANVECVSRTLSYSTAARPLLPASSGEAASSDPAILEELSILDLSKSLLDEGSCVSETNLSSAIPGSQILNNGSGEAFLWQKHVPFELPDQTVLDSLVKHYFISVNWFMHVVDEESFKQMMAEHNATNTVPQSRLNFCSLLCLVWALGAHYLWTDPSAPFDRQFLATFRLQAVQYVESRFLSLLSHPDLEAVQVGILLGSFHLFNGLPNLGFGILGSTIKIAQLIGLHRGFLRSSVGGRTSNTYATVWWALEIFEKYAAIAFGRPCGIDDSDCDVPHIRVPTNDISHLRYHREKCHLYRIIGAFLGRRKDLKRSGSLQDIHSQLRVWFSSLPTELRVHPATEADDDPNLLQMQAVALQLAYDNIQVVLHRQAVLVPRPTKSSNSQNSASIEQLTESALRTALMPNNKALLPICRSSHAAMHVAICLFTTGVVLAGLRLTQSIDSHGDELMSGLQRIITFLRSFPGQHYNLVSQCLDILQTLQSKCLSSTAPKNSEASALPDVARNELAESILESTRWTDNDFSTFVDLENTTPTHLLDFASGSSLQGVAQAWLWSDIDGAPPLSHDQNPNF